MNIPVLAMLQALLTWLGDTSTALGNGSIGLIAAPFSGSQSTSLGGITEANYQGYARQSIGNSPAIFTGSDGNAYAEFNTVEFAPTGSATVNTIYGMFWTPGNSTTTLWLTDGLIVPYGMSGTNNRLTITPRFGLNPGGNFGLNVVSS